MSAYDLMCRVRYDQTTGDLLRRDDGLLQETLQGPSLDAMYEQQTVCVDDLTADPRWPGAGPAGYCGAGRGQRAVLPAVRPRRRPLGR